jgi:hypothetical protein
MTSRTGVADRMQNLVDLEDEMRYQFIMDEEESERPKGFLDDDDRPIQPSKQALGFDDMPIPTAAPKPSSNFIEDIPIKPKPQPKKDVPQKAAKQQKQTEVVPTPIQQVDDPDGESLPPPPKYNFEAMIE